MKYKSIDSFKIGDVVKCKNRDLIKIVNIETNNDGCIKNENCPEKTIYTIKNVNSANISNNILEIDEEFLLNILNYGFEDSINNRTVLTHNCMQRLVCGQLGSIASRMALDNMQATTIDGKHKGAGMTKSQGIINNVQYYFTEQTWIEDWYAKRGLTEKGFEPGEDPNEEIDPSTINLGDDEEITIDKKVTRMEFNKEIREIDNTKSQKFEEV